MIADGKILCARNTEVLCIRFEGKISFSLGPAFLDFVDQVFQRDTWQDMVADLTAATAIDSTGLGLIAKCARLLGQRRKRRLTVLSTNDKITRALIGVGLERLVTIVADANTAQIELEELPAVDADKAAKTRAVLDAHRELMTLNEKNAAEFRSVVDFLEQESRRR